MKFCNQCSLLVHNHFFLGLILFMLQLTFSVKMTSHPQLLNSYRSFATDAERDGISSSLQQTEAWLYDDGDDESEHVYTGKLEDLKKVLPVYMP